jgi:hypothetical protein
VNQLMAVDSIREMRKPSALARRPVSIPQALSCYGRFSIYMRLSGACPRLEKNIIQVEKRVKA